jgi:hypothetical protein
MTVSKMAILSRTYQNTQDMGRKAVQADAQIVIEGFEDMTLLIKQFPWPIPTVGDNIPYFGPLGQEMGQPKQVKTKQEGPCGIYETVRSHAHEMLKAILANGGTFNATIYAGRPDDYTQKESIIDAFLVMDQPDRDWENDSQVLLLAGTLHYHWFANQ